MNKRLSFTLIVPLLMVFFFARNIVLEKSEHLDSWMGGGMRMFGKIDKTLYRISGMTVIHNDSTYFINFRNIPELEDMDVASRIMPSDKRLQRFYSVLKSMDWCYDQFNNEIKLSTSACSSKIASNQISEIQVYRTDFNDDSNQVSFKLINSFKGAKTK